MEQINGGPTLDLAQIIRQSWLTGAFDKAQLAERFNVSVTYVESVVDETDCEVRRRQTRPSIEVIDAFYNAMPTELAASFGRHVVQLTGERAALLEVAGTGSYYVRRPFREDNAPECELRPKWLYANAQEIDQDNTDATGSGPLLEKVVTLHTEC